MAVVSNQEGIDPIGSCIGQRGSRITTIIDELGGEKIDVIQYSDDARDYIKHALSPAKVDHVDLDEENKEAIAHVASDQFSLAIGRGGQNVRLAAELTGWKIKVVDLGGAQEVSSDGEVVEGEVEPKVGPEDAGVSHEEAAPAGADLDLPVQQDDVEKKVEESKKEE